MKAYNPATPQHDVLGGEASSVSASEREANDDARASPSGGLAGALARGEAARNRWAVDGEVVTPEVLVAAWWVNLEYLRQAVARRDVFAVYVRGRSYFPAEFVQLDCLQVTAISRQMAVLDASSQFIFWKRRHGALRGRTVVEALASGSSPMCRVVEFARHFVAQHAAELGSSLAMADRSLERQLISEEELSEIKRRNQQDGLDTKATDRITQDQMSWSSAGKTRKLISKDWPC